jgi:hypothetical protein
MATEPSDPVPDYTCAACGRTAEARAVRGRDAAYCEGCDQVFDPVAAGAAEGP